MMKERPILFSGPMVRAILTGNKTQTRRIMKSYPLPAVDVNQWIKHHKIKCPYGVPGDRLWVRETWRETGVKQEPYAYRADEESLNLVGEQGQILSLSYRWRPSIHMPRGASRITLEVTAVRVERLWDISEADARAEGMESVPGLSLDISYGTEDVVSAFASLWESINAKRTGCLWNDNPWVWCINFRRFNNDCR